jgi:hypothetical protein
MRQSFPLTNPPRLAHLEIEQHLSEHPRPEHLSLSVSKVNARISALDLVIEAICGKT